ncbi:MAG: flavodoxin family protein [Clostridia bacterium]|nr:flavodoxin family protein [Clostridia bacterium]
MKTAIVYFSLNGNTEFVASEIAGKLGADAIKLIPKKAFPDSGFKKFLWGGKSAVMKEKPELEPYEFDARKYDRVIFGTPVWASRFTPPIRTFVADNADALKGKRFAAFTCFSGGGADKALARLKELLGADLDAELILVDPKDKPSDGNAAKIATFCEKLGE